MLDFSKTICGSQPSPPSPALLPVEGLVKTLRECGLLKVIVSPPTRQHGHWGSRLLAEGRTHCVSLDAADSGFELAWAQASVPSDTVCASAARASALTLSPVAAFRGLG